MVVLRWTKNNSVPDEGGGPDLFLYGFLPWIFVFFYQLRMEYYFRFRWTIMVHRCTEHENCISLGWAVRCAIQTCWFSLKSFPLAADPTASGKVRWHIRGLSVNSECIHSVVSFGHGNYRLVNGGAVALVHEAAGCCGLFFSPSVLNLIKLTIRLSGNGFGIPREVSGRCCLLSTSAASSPFPGRRREFH